MGTVKRHVKAIIQFRRATEPEWIQYNPILNAGEPALSTDRMKVKVGDGVTDWINLEYIDQSSNQQISFVNSLDGLLGEEDHLYIDKTDGTAFLWENNEFVEIESSSIGELQNRVTTTEQEIALQAGQIAELIAEIERKADKTYIHRQQTASALWTINHNLGKFPSITIVDSAGTVVAGDIILQTTERAVISFNGAFSGKAYCN